MNALCAANNAKIAALPVASNTSLTGLNKLVQVEDSTINQIKAIEPPAELAPKAHAWLGTLTQTVSLSHQIVVAAQTHNAGQMSTLGNRVQTLTRRGRSQALALGLHTCAQTGGRGGH